MTGNDVRMHRHSKNFFAVALSLFLVATQVGAAEKSGAIFFDATMNPADPALLKAVNERLAQAFETHAHLEAPDPSSRDFTSKLETGIWPAECTDSRCLLTIAGLFESAEYMLESRIRRTSGGCEFIMEIVTVPGGLSKNRIARAAACTAPALSSAAVQVAKAIWPPADQPEFSPPEVVATPPQTKPRQPEKSSAEAVDDLAALASNFESSFAARLAPDMARRGGNATAKSAGSSENLAAGAGANQDRLADLPSTKKNRTVESEFETSDAVAIQGGLDADAVRNVVNRHIKSVQFCYNNNLVRRPDMKGKVTVDIVLNANGGVNDVRVKDSTLGDADTETCIVDKVKRWQFPAPTQAPVTISYPFVFVKS